MPPAYCLSNVEIVGSFLYVFQGSSVLLRSVRARPLKKLCLLVWTENWLTSIQFIIIMKTQDSRKVYTTTGPAAGGVWRLNPPPRVLLAYLPQDGQSLRSCKGILKDASNVHVISKPTQIPIYRSTNKYAIPPIAKHKGQATECRLGRWQSNNNLESNEKEFPRAGLRAE